MDSSQVTGAVGLQAGERRGQAEVACLLIEVLSTAQSTVGRWGQGEV